MRHSTLLVLLLSYFAFAQTSFSQGDQDETSFSPPDGSGHTWPDELPTRFLLTFDFRNDQSDGFAVVKFDGQELFLNKAVEDWQTARVAINTDSDLYSTWSGKKVISNEKPLAQNAPSESGPARWQSDIDDYDLSGDFTIATSFNSQGSGTIISKCAPEGEWTPDSKALFIKGGHLVYDIGWLGTIRTKMKITGGKTHHVALTCNDGRVRLFVDGKLAGEKDDFARDDPDGSVLKIGSAADDFGGDLDATELEFVRFWKRALPDDELKALGQGKEANTNTPLLNWKPSAPGENDSSNQGLWVGAKAGQLNIRRMVISPLAEVDHRRLIHGWDHLSLERGARIYQGLCITCHGDQKVEGTLPTALRFHSGEFKNGGDPFSMYQTLTKGYNLMVAQPWMTPTQKYDVIHYIRETFIREDNPKQLVKIDDGYLATLPEGIGIGPEEATMFADNQDPKYKQMNFGPALFWTLQVSKEDIAYKGIAIRLDEGPGGVSKGKRWMLYDHDTMRVAAAWTGDEFVDWRGIAFDQSHGSHTSIVGDIAFQNPPLPGWLRPGSSTDDVVAAEPFGADKPSPAEAPDHGRFRGRDGKLYGPLPRDWAHYKGLYLHGDRAVLHYTVGDAEIHEMPGCEIAPSMHETPIFTRTLNIGKSSKDLTLRVSPQSSVVIHTGGGELVATGGFHFLKIPAAETPVKAKLFITSVLGSGHEKKIEEYVATSGKAIDLQSLMDGGKKRWPGVILTEGKMGEENEAFAVDEIELPGDDRSPWQSWMRLGGFDFFADGKRAAVATWLGDVWIVDGLGGDFKQHQWQRIATGLFQPLGVKIVDGTIYVSCRDQIAELHDKNGDGEIDYIRSFNNDHQVTEHFHEFAMGLQTDAEGNFYYAKSARHAKTAIVAHHGTLLKVSADGSQTEIIATGFRAANGVCLNPDGSFIVTDQEGHWNPKNRINWVKKGGFYGNMYGYHDVTDDSDEAMEPPLCWITNKFDRSPGELMWVPQEAKWGALNGSLLNLSYGMGSIFLVPHEKLADGRVQGGMISLGMDFPTGTMRGRFHPGDGQLYTTGMFAWAGNKHQDGGFYRVRKTDKASHLPVGLKATKDGMILTFTEKINPMSATQASNFKVKTWGLKRTKNYGSKHYDEHAVKVESVTVLDDGKSVLLRMPEIAPTWSMEIQYKLKGADGKDFTGTIHNTVHALR
ncbi:MAG: hypothetical protein ACI8XO_004006 [Verrucomicrobiales bacterium]|jgi:hypothetical protein